MVHFILDTQNPSHINISLKRLVSLRGQNHVSFSVEQCIENILVEGERAEDEWTKLLSVRNALHKNKHKSHYISTLGSATHLIDWLSAREVVVGKVGDKTLLLLSSLDKHPLQITAGTCRASSVLPKCQII